ncbi:hypothetical protein VNO77_03561 [Canavalia gladiata]|uniref:Uncharacterized protein n=1 Tax=Canavalia gladiata TaxID=3824 RepID=A0AAN9N1C5_CANGL
MTLGFWKRAWPLPRGRKREQWIRVEGVAFDLALGQTEREDLEPRSPGEGFGYSIEVKEDTAKDWRT